MRIPAFILIGIMLGCTLQAQPMALPGGAVRATAVNDFHQRLRANNISMWVGNNGSMSHDPVYDGPGFEWPKGSGRSLIFAEGFLVGGIVNGQVRVSGSTFRCGLQAGCILPDGTADFSCNPRYRVFRIRQLTPAEYSRLGSEEQATLRRDFNEWPACDGAPWTDVDRDGKYDADFDAWLRGDRSKDAPQFAGEEVLWYVANDLDAQRCRDLYGSAPMGLEFQVMAWASAGDALLDNTVFVRCRVINKSAQTISGVYIGRWVDPDLGDASDDLTGVDTSAMLCYCYNGRPADGVYTSPPAVGTVWLQTPVVPHPDSEAMFDFRKRQGFRNLPLSSFAYYIGGDPVYRDPDAGEAYGNMQMYNYMRGKLHSDAPYIDPTNGREVLFPLAGDPLWKTGWMDGLTHAPGDRRMLGCSGPFEFAPGDTQEVVVATTVCDARNHLLSVPALRRQAQSLRRWYSSGMRPNPLREVHHGIQWSDADNFVLTVRAGATGAGTVDAVLSAADGTEFIAFELYDDGQHDDAGAKDGIFGGVLSHEALPAGADLSLRITTAWDAPVQIHVASQLPLMGDVRFGFEGVLSDHLNYDGRANPGEQVIPNLQLVNKSLQPMGGWIVHPASPGDGALFRYDSLAPARGETVTSISVNTPQAYFTVQVPEDAKAGDRIRIPVRVLSRQHCQWTDTLSLDVEAFAQEAHEGLWTHTKGSASGTLGWRAENPPAMKTHRYRVTVHGEDWEQKTLSVEDVTDQRMMLTGIPLPDAYAHHMPSFDGMRINLGSAVDYYAVDDLGNALASAYPPAYRFDHPGRAWFTLLNPEAAPAYLWPMYGPSFGNAHDVFDMKPVQLVFDRAQGQTACRYLSRDLFLDCPFTGTVEIPLRAYDISDPAAPVQIALGFLEREGSAGDDGTWLPIGNPAETYEHLIIFSDPYTQFPGREFAINLASPGVKLNVLYVLWPARNPAVPLYADGDGFTIIPQIPVSKRDEYELDLTATTVSSPDIRRASCTLYQNFPNPATGSATIAYELTEAQPVNLSLCDLLGRELLRIAQGRKQAGLHMQTVDLSGLAPGSYMVSLISPQGRSVRMLTLLK